MDWKAGAGLALALAVGCSTVFEARESQRALAAKGEDAACDAAPSPVDFRRQSLEGLVAFALTNRPSVVSKTLAVRDARLALKALAAEAPVVSDTPWTAPKLSVSGGHSESSDAVHLDDGDLWRAEGGASAADMLESAEQKVYAIRRGRSAQNMVPVSQILQDVMNRLEELSNSESNLPGLSTGLSAVDSKINGLNKSDLLLLAARPGMGKTSMALNVALSAAKTSGKTVAIFSLEMSREQLVTRLIAAEGLVENTRLTTGNLRESDWQRIAEAASSLSRMDIRIDDNPLLTVADMNAKCRRLDNLGLVVIDYLQLMTSAGGKGYSGENRQQAVSDISRMLKIMAKELQVPVLCLSQLSRANEKRDDKRPMLSDLRESGAIEQDADIVLFLYRDDYYNSDSEKRNVAECIVAKNRHGETGKVELRWMPEYTAFGTLENRYDDEE